MKSKRSVYVAALGVWFLFLVVAFALGTARELLLTPLVGDHTAHIVGTLVVVAAFLGIMFLFVRRMQDRCVPRDFWLIGLLWLLMTAGFEFLFFHYAAGVPWDDLLADYNLAEGRIWVLVLLTLLLGPRAMFAILSRNRIDRLRSSRR